MCIRDRFKRYTVEGNIPSWHFNPQCDLDLGRRDFLVVCDTPSWSDTQTCKILSKVRAEGNFPSWPLNPQCDLDLGRRDFICVRDTPSWSDTQTCKILSKSLHWFKSYRAEGNPDGRTDRRTDGRTERMATICSPEKISGSIKTFIPLLAKCGNPSAGFK